VLVQCLLHVTDMDVELAHLLSEGDPTRWGTQPGQWICSISIGSTIGHGWLIAICASPSWATCTLLVYGLIPTGGTSGCNPRHVSDSGPRAIRRCGRLRPWLWWRLEFQTRDNAFRRHCIEPVE
jgi:hypothetical protein